MYKPVGHTELVGGLPVLWLFDYPTWYNDLPQKSGFENRIQEE